MTGRSFSISIDLSHLLQPTGPITQASFPHLSFAVKKIGQAVQAQWVRYANGEQLPDGKVIQSRTGEYARSILLREMGDFSVEVYSDLSYALGIEEGFAQYDMKQILNSSLKVRISAAGKRYLIIPFRWNHPQSVLGNNMPEAVHEWWRDPDRKPSSISGTYRRISGTGAIDIKTRGALTVPGWRYNWGSRLGKSDLAAMQIGGSAAKRMEGMVNFRKPGGGAGYGQHSQYITFRVMMEGSKGWIRPAQPGKWPAKQTVAKFTPIAEEAFRRAVEADIRALVGIEI